MKSLPVIALAAVAGLAFAQEIKAPAANARPTREEILQKMLAKTGGFVETEGSGAKIILLDTRREQDGAFGRAVQVLTKTYHVPVTNEVAALENGSCPFEASVGKLKAEKALMVIALTECEKAASLAVFPEDRVAVINAGKYGTGATAEEKETRIVKEVWRAIGFIGGVGYATTEASVMQPVTSPIELDNYKFAFLQPMELQRLRAMMEKYGSKIGRRVTYKKAVEDGWAPAPTNDYQKAIWDAVKAAKEAAPKAEEKPAEAAAK